MKNRRYRHIILSLLLAWLLPVVAVAQIQVSAPSHVAAGENFRLAYTINTDDVEDFRCGAVPGGLEVIAGPYQSSQSSFQVINGHTSSSSSVTITYTLYAAKDGSFTIGPAHAIVRGRHLQSRAVRVAVTGRARNGGGAPQMHNDPSAGAAIQSAGSRITPSELFIRVTANKKHVHEQEPVLLTYKVYTTVDLTSLEGKMPDLTGFHSQEVQLPQQKTFHDEVIGGRHYKCVTWSQYVMYPQMTGKLQIPSITFKGVVVQENRNVDPFEAFFNGGSGYVEVKKNIVAPGMTIQVDPLPKAPANFSGGVGHFNISASLNKKEVKAGDPITLRVVVSGIGNLKLIKQPVVNFPKDFDRYDAKVTDKTKLTANGVEGNMIYDFLAVPRNQGSYTIPSVTMTYYDVTANSYKTIHTQPFTLTVDKGDGSSSVSDYNDLKDKDIHSIHQGNVKLHQVDSFFFGSVGYIITLFLIIAIFVALLVVFRRRALENADIVRLRGKNADRVARKRLKRATDLMIKGQSAAFYDEVLRALWGYAGDRMNMRPEELSRENVQSVFEQHHIDEDTIRRFVDALDECEFERYAPGDPAGNMQKTFEKAMTAIMDIENFLKAKKQKKDSGFHSHGDHGESHHTFSRSDSDVNAQVKSHGFDLKMILIFFLTTMTLGLFSLNASAVTKRQADAEYLQGNYQQAILDYKYLLSEGVSADLYYNLGNAYYRSDNLTQAILAYERASLLDPGNSDIRFNLEFARSKTIDKITPENELFFVTAYKALVSMQSVDGWAETAIVAIILSLLLVLVYLFAPQLSLRKAGFYGAVVTLLLFLVSNLFAWQQKHELEARTGAIITAPSVQVQKTPAKNGDDSFVLHEGTRVDIEDDSMASWYQVKTADGREGWVERKSLEII
ncbi:MAG: BatD family protein [Prevotellaceae bacterium]|nr:BatD family protein [Prevotellaceae bacterium]